MPPLPQIKDEGAWRPKRAIFPSLILGGGVVSMFHLITMFRVLQFPSSGQEFLSRQLQLSSIFSDWFDDLLIWALLWLEIMVFTFLIQL